jgi:hypothetical protein
MNKLGTGYAWGAWELGWLYCRMMERMTAQLMQRRRHLIDEVWRIGSNGTIFEEASGRSFRLFGGRLGLEGRECTEDIEGEREETRQFLVEIREEKGGEKGREPGVCLSCSRENYSGCQFCFSAASGIWGELLCCRIQS